MRKNTQPYNEIVRLLNLMIGLMLLSGLMSACQKCGQKNDDEPESIAAQAGMPQVQLIPIQSAIGYQAGSFQLAVTNAPLDPSQIQVEWMSDAPARFKVGERIQAAKLSELVDQKELCQAETTLGPINFQLHTAQGEQAAKINVHLKQGDQVIGQGVVTWEAKGPQLNLEKPIADPAHQQITVAVHNEAETVNKKDQLYLTYQTTNGALIQGKTSGKIALRKIAAQQTKVIKLPIKRNGQVSTQVTLGLQLGAMPIGASQTITYTEDIQLTVDEPANLVLPKQVKQVVRQVHNKGYHTTAKNQLKWQFKRIVGNHAQIKASKLINPDVFMMDLPTIKSNQAIASTIKIDPQADETAAFTMQLFYRDQAVTQPEIIQWNAPIKTQVTAQLMGRDGPTKAVVKLILSNETGRKLSEKELKQLFLRGDLPKDTTIEQADGATVLGKSLVDLGIQDLTHLNECILYLKRNQNIDQQLEGLCLVYKAKAVSKPVNLLWERVPKITLMVDKNKLANGDNQVILSLVSDQLITHETLQTIAFHYEQSKVQKGRVNHNADNIQDKTLAAMLPIQTIQPHQKVDLTFNLANFNFPDVRYQTHLFLGLTGAVEAAKVTVTKVGH